MSKVKQIQGYKFIINKDYTTVITPEGKKQKMNKQTAQQMYNVLADNETQTITKLNKMYALGILSDIMTQANYMITLSDGNQKLCVDTDIIDKISDKLLKEIQ